MQRFLQVVSGGLMLLLAASPATAQQALSGWTVAGDTQVQISEKQFALSGHAEIEQGDTKLYADHVDFFPDQDRAIATGNVLFSQGNNRIAADTADFNTKTRLGTFQHAYGIATMQPQRRAPTATAVAAPQMTGQDTDVYFFGDVVEKIGPKKYKITNGGFTTCLQPTPRWDIHADTVVLHVNHYTLLRQAVLNVKGVPLLYLPVMYYPTKEEQRATGFLLPTYGVTSLRGQSITNHFFWAIDRSQDLTIEHNWYSKAGQGVGSEYRYNWGGGSDGNLQALRLSGSPSTQGDFTLRGSANQMLPGRLRARANVYYFSSLATNQTFNNNIYDQSSNQRAYSGNVVGAWRTYSLNATFDHRESFYNSTDSIVSGSTPRIALTRNERPISAGSPVYFMFGTEFAHLQSESKTVGIDLNKSLSRFDFSPQIRYPFKRWQFFTVNSSAQWRDTFYTRSLDPTDATATIVRDETLNRGYYTLQAQATGPVFNRIWDTPNNGYAQRFKHTIEPVFTIQRVSATDPALSSRIIKIDSIDFTVNGNTTLTYGINNRLYAKRRVGQISIPQEILTVSLAQSHYTNPDASQFDASYQTGSAAKSTFSPVKLDVRAQPTTSITAGLHAEVDSRFKKLRQLSLNGTNNWTNRVQTTIGWTRRFFIDGLPAFNDPKTLDDYLNLSVNAQTRDNRFGGRYILYYDILRSTMQQQRFSWFYNAQCCGLALEYQTYHLGGASAFSGISADHRFFLSFTLAGLGSVSPFNGAMSGLPR